jgi:hypothetical protein
VQGKLTLERYELQEFVILLSILITQIGVILTSKADHLFDQQPLLYEAIACIFFIVDAIESGAEEKEKVMGYSARQ